MIFDVCGTLYDSNTTMDFCKWLSKGKRFRYLLFVLSSTPGKAFNKLSVSLFKFDLTRNVHIYTLRGNSPQFIEVEAKKFVESSLSIKKIERVHELLAQFNKDDTILVSASIEPVIKAVAESLGIKRYYATSLRINEEGYTGAISLDLLGNKASLFEDNVIDLVVTDNKTDYSLCKLADRVIIVSKKKNLGFWQDSRLHIERIIGV